MATSYCTDKNGLMIDSALCLIAGHDHSALITPTPTTGAPLIFPQALQLRPPLAPQDPPI